MQKEMKAMREGRWERTRTTCNLNEDRASKDKERPSLERIKSLCERAKKQTKEVKVIMEKARVDIEDLGLHRSQGNRRSSGAQCKSPDGNQHW